MSDHEGSPDFNGLRVNTWFGLLNKYSSDHTWNQLKYLLLEFIILRHSHLDKQCGQNFYEICLIFTF